MTLLSPEKGEVTKVAEAQAKARKSGRFYLEGSTPRSQEIKCVKTKEHTLSKLLVYILAALIGATRGASGADPPLWRK